MTNPLEQWHLWSKLLNDGDFNENIVVDWLFCGLIEYIPSKVFF